MQMIPQLSEPSLDPSQVPLPVDVRGWAEEWLCGARLCRSHSYESRAEGTGSAGDRSQFSSLLNPQKWAL